MSVEATPSVHDFGTEDNLIASTFSTPYIVRGSGVEVEDAQGNRYLDFEAGPGVASVGHCHPKVVEAIRDQAGILLQAPGRYYTPLAQKVAGRLAKAAAGRLRRTFFANSGAEANDGAIKLALKHAHVTRKDGFGILALEHGFHGRLSLPLALTGMAGRKKGFGPYGTFPGVVHAPAPYCYRCPFGLQYPGCALRCAAVLEEHVLTRVPGAVAAMIAEPVLGVGGIIVPPDGYWQRVQEFCRRHNITFITDEVFTGFGRTGRMFAHQHWNLEPDIMTFAKAIGGGVPLGGFIATEEVSRAFAFGDHFTTFGANNQLGLRAALAVMDILVEERIPEHAASMGEHLMEGLRGLARRFPIVGDVRGKGLMVGVEIVADPETRAPDAGMTQRIKAELQNEGILVSTTGVYGNVLRLTPPLVIQKAHVDRLLETMERALQRLAG